jgi:hypothetical protein
LKAISVPITPFNSGCRWASVTKRKVNASCEDAANREEGIAAEIPVAPRRVRNCLRLVEFTPPS